VNLLQLAFHGDKFVILALLAHFANSGFQRLLERGDNLIDGWLSIEVTPIVLGNPPNGTTHFVEGFVPNYFSALRIRLVDGVPAHMYLTVHWANALADWWPLAIQSSQLLAQGG
jgi:hypothetical protein